MTTHVAQLAFLAAIVSEAFCAEGATSLWGICKMIHVWRYKPRST
jgi:hypothetical protein